MKGEATSVLGSAIAAAMAGNIALALFVLLSGDHQGRAAFQVGPWTQINLLYVLPAAISAALAAWVFCRLGLRTRGRTFWVALAICVLGDAINFVLMLFWLKAWLWMHDGTATSAVDMLDWKNPEVSVWWGILIAMFTITFGIVPALLLEFGVVLRARHLARVQASGAMA